MISLTISIPKFKKKNEIKRMSNAIPTGPSIVLCQFQNCRLTGNTTYKRRYAGVYTYFVRNEQIIERNKFVMFFRKKCNVFIERKRL